MYVSSVVISVALSSAFQQIQGSPLFLNQGGVFQSPAARQHFESQFGLGFFAQLAAAQRAAVGFGPVAAVAPVAPVTPVVPTAAPSAVPTTEKTDEHETAVTTTAAPSAHQPRVVVRKGRRRQQNQLPAEQISAAALQQIQRFQQAQLLQQQQQLLLLRAQQQQLQVAQTPVFFDSSFARFQNSPLLSQLEQQQQQVNLDLDNSV